MKELWPLEENINKMPFLRKCRLAVTNALSVLMTAISEPAIICLQFGSRAACMHEFRFVPD